MGVDTSAQVGHGKRWAARAALVAAALAVLLPLGYGGVDGVLLLFAALLGVAVTAAALWWALTRRGPLRWVAAVLAAVAPGAVITLFAVTGLLWAVPVSLALWTVAVWSGRYALRSDRTRARARRNAGRHRRGARSSS